MFDKIKQVNNNKKKLQRLLNEIELDRKFSTLDAEIMRTDFLTQQT